MVFCFAMNDIIKLYDLLGAEIRSRSNAEILKEAISNYSEPIVDLNGVSFISRSFADELCIMTEKHIVRLCNANGIVKNMLSAVSESRKGKRVREIDNSQIKEFDDMKSLSDFLATIY